MSAHPALVAFSSRLGGVSTGDFAEANISTRVGDDPVAVRANRRLLLESLGLGDRTVVTAQQSHTATVLRVDRDIRGDALVADGMVTTDTDVALLIGVADCLPLALITASVVGVLHVGRRGLLRGIVEAGVLEMGRAGADPVSITAQLGPRIGPCCYEVGEGVRSELSERYGASFASTTAGSPSVDLTAGATQALTQAGVNAVLSSAVCTYESPGYFSARRGTFTGCQGGLVALARSNPPGGNAR